VTGSGDSAPFSLLVPVYHGDDPDFFERAVISSTSEQTLQPEQVVIVRDGPVSDAMQRTIDKVAQKLETPVAVVALEKNRGLTTALNSGLDACTNDIVARIDADDVSLPDRFVRQWALIKDGYDLVGTGMVEFERNTAELGATRVPPVGSKRIREHARTHNPFNHPTMMYRLAALDAIGRYKPFGSMEDYWLGVRLIDSGAKVENIADALVAYRVGSGVFQRRGGFKQAKTEIALQRAMLKIGFITPTQFVRNVVLKGAYRLFPAGLKRVLFRRFVSGGLRGDRRAR
jgi:glycosyltransferase involved in cell wall biosynthesis